MNKLKGYVRYDVTGRMVPGSAILAKQMPKGGGDWLEIDMDATYVPTTFQGMRAWIRLNRLGQIVPSSNIFAKSMPRTGEWKEIYACKLCGGVTTTTTTTDLCENPQCSTELTAGHDVGFFFTGYEISLYGSLSPNCGSVHSLFWGIFTGLDLRTTNCYSSVLVKVDGQEIPMTFIEVSFNLYTWRNTTVPNPFPIVGGVYNVEICGIECTTTTTTTAI